jgi:MFS family permease
MPLASLYAESRLAPVIQRSLFFILLSNIFGNMHVVICGSGTPAMVQLSNFLGAGDFEYGIITGIPMAAALLQIPFSVIVNRTQKRKRYLLTYGLISRALWFLFGLVPFFVPADPDWLRMWTIIFLLGISSCMGSFINVCWMPWMADLMPMNIRGRWFSVRDCINSVFGVVLGLIVAYILDTVDGPVRYTIVFLMGGTFGVLDMISYGFVKEVYSSPPVKMSVLKSVGIVMRDKPFLHFTIFWTAWCFTANMGGSYITRYVINEMGMSNMGATVFGTITASFITILVISRWGKFLDRYGCKPVMFISGLVASTTQAFMLFIGYGGWLPLFLMNFVGAAFWSASNLAATTMQLSYSPADKRPSYIAFFSCVTSLVGVFAGILTGGALLDWMESMGVSGSVGYDRYKITLTIAIILRVSIVLILVPKMKNDRDATTSDMMRDFGRWVRMIPRRLALIGKR